MLKAESKAMESAFPFHMKEDRRMGEHPRRLYKSRTDRMIAGVCGGVAEYLAADPAVVRVLWALSVFLGGTGVILYIVAMVIMPTNPQHAQASAGSGDRGKFWGLLLVGAGVLLLVDNLDVIPLWDILSWQGTVAVLLITIGATLILSHFGKSRSSPPDVHAKSGGPQRMYRSVRDRKILGVCGGIADYFDIDSTLVRLLFVLLVFSSIGFALLLYIILGVVLQNEQLQATPA